MHYKLGWKLATYLSNLMMTSVILACFNDIYYYKQLTGSREYTIYATDSEIVVHKNE